MCFDAKTSLISFVLGIIISIGVGLWGIRQRDETLALLSFGWSWVVFMQWWEYMIWSQWNPVFASKMAFVFNVLQIPVLYFLFFLVSNASLCCKYIATMIVFVYLCVFFYPQSNTFQVQTRHRHLIYPWWSNSWRSAFYFIGLIAVFLLLIRPLSWSFCCVTTLFLLLFFSKLIYKSENVPSLWCFFAVCFPVLALGYRYLC